MMITLTLDVYSLCCLSAFAINLDDTAVSDGFFIEALLKNCLIYWPFYQDKYDTKDIFGEYKRRQSNVGFVIGLTLLAKNKN